MKTDITIAQGFKFKAKLIKDINELSIRLRASNSKSDKDDTIPYNPEEVFKEYVEKKADLVALKTAIIKASMPVYNKIFELSEIKSEIQTLRRLDTTHGKKEKAPMYGSETPTFINYTAYLKQEDVDKKTKELEDKIEKLQEELDQHNFNTKLQF